jgi:hypothetical protein
MKNSILDLEIEGATAIKNAAMKSHKVRVKQVAQVLMGGKK